MGDRFKIIDGLKAGFHVIVGPGWHIQADDEFINKYLTPEPNKDDPSPIRTRNEIVPGVYGKLQIGGEYQIPDCSDPGEPVSIGLDISIIGNTMTADELTPKPDNSAYLAAMRDFRDRYHEAERVMGGSVSIQTIEFKRAE